MLFYSMALCFWSFKLRLKELRGMSSVLIGHFFKLSGTSKLKKKKRPEQQE
jgi:hypothetical protein